MSNNNIVTLEGIQICVGSAHSTDPAVSTSGFDGFSKTGDDGTSKSGDLGVSKAGIDGKASSGVGGVIIIQTSKDSVVVGQVGVDGIQPNQLYKVVDDKLVSTD